ncbi:MAG TPA: hypothetical protein VHI13_17630 [Candidatus Kapabacteria bacterium]|nr:hypothetical protein [Candidatus Kapabacteria bacterium]
MIAGTCRYRTGVMVAAAILLVTLLVTTIGARTASAQPTFTSLCQTIDVINNTSCDIDLNLQAFPGAWPPLHAPASTASHLTLPSPAEISGLADNVGTIYPINSPIYVSVEGCGPDDWSVAGIHLGLGACCCNVCINPCTCTITINPGNCFH